MLLASNARESRNTAEENAAFDQAAKATTAEAYSDSLLSFAQPDLPGDASPLERAYLSTEVLGIEAAIEPLQALETRREGNGEPRVGLE